MAVKEIVPIGILSVYISVVDFPISWTTHNLKANLIIHVVWVSTWEFWYLLLIKAARLSQQQWKLSQAFEIVQPLITTGLHNMGTYIVDEGSRHN